MVTLLLAEGDSTAILIAGVLGAVGSAIPVVISWINRKRAEGARARKRIIRVARMKEKRAQEDLLRKQELQAIHAKVETLEKSVTGMEDRFHKKVDELEGVVSGMEGRFFDKLDKSLRPFTDPEAVSEATERATNTKRDILESRQQIGKVEGLVSALTNTVNQLQGAKEARDIRIQQMSDRSHLQEQEYGGKFGALDERLKFVERLGMTLEREIKKLLKEEE